MSSSNSLKEQGKSLKSALSQTASQVLDPANIAHAARQQLNEPDENELRSILALLVGDENAECAEALLSALLLLGADSAQIAAAISTLDSPLPMDVQGPVLVLLQDIINVALVLPPKCMDDSEATAAFRDAYDIIRLSRQSGGVSQRGGLTADEDSAIRQRMVDLIEGIRGMEILQKYPGLSEQLVDRLVGVAQQYDVTTQIDFVLTLLPDDALKRIDEALNMKASELPGAQFLEKLNQYEEKIGLDILPNDLGDEYAVDLVIKAAGMTGLLRKEDTQSLGRLTRVLRIQMMAARVRTPLQRIAYFVHLLKRDTQRPVIDVGSEPDYQPLPGTIVPAPVRPDRQRDTRYDRIQKIKEETQRMKVLAGIR